MNLEEQLTQLLRAHGELEDSNGTCECGHWTRADDHAAHVARVVLEELNPRVKTVEQLHGLPPQAVVRSADCDIWQRHSVGWDNLSEGGGGPIKGSKDVALPARLLWHPSWVGVTDQ